MEPSVERGLCLRNEVQDLEVRRSPWMIRGYSKCKGKYPSEKEAEGDSREEGRPHKQGGRDRRDAATGQGLQGPQELEKAGRHVP